MGPPSCCTSIAPSATGGASAPDHRPDRPASNCAPRTPRTAPRGAPSGRGPVAEEWYTPDRIDWLLRQEDAIGLDTPKPYRDFETRVFNHRKDLRALIEALVADGKKILGYGASTKGNVLLQFCGFTAKHIPYIAEVNEDKFGSFTPGTNIPIISEKDAKAMKPDYLFVLPWHFKNGILEREKEYLAGGGKFIFPLPEIEIV